MNSINLTSFVKRNEITIDELTEIMREKSVEIYTPQAILDIKKAVNDKLEKGEINIFNSGNDIEKSNQLFRELVQYNVISENHPPRTIFIKEMVENCIEKGTYKDNYLNRKMGRVGQPYKKEEAKLFGNITESVRKQEKERVTNLLEDKYDVTMVEVRDFLNSSNALALPYRASEKQIGSAIAKWFEEGEKGKLGKVDNKFEETYSKEQAKIYAEGGVPLTKEQEKLISKELDSAKDALAAWKADPEAPNQKKWVKHYTNLVEKYKDNLGINNN